MKHRISLILLIVLVTGCTAEPAIAPTASPVPTLTSSPIPLTPTITPSPTPAVPKEPTGLIAFYLKQGNVGGIAVINADGSGDPIMLSAHPTGDSKPVWSPDGSRIAFESLRDDVTNLKFLDIYVMNSDGSHLERITNTDGWYAQPDWSPDGSRLAIASDKDEKGNSDLYILDLDTRELTRITNDPAVDRNPSWSPDAAHLVFFSNRSGNWDVYTVDIETGETTQLTNDAGDDFHPDWSPDGQNILFSSSRDGDAEIYIMDADGKNQKRLTNTPGNDTDPEWSPYGNYFAYSHDTSEFGEIYIMDLIGSPPRLLFENTSLLTTFLEKWCCTQHDTRDGKGTDRRIIARRIDCAALRVDEQSSRFGRGVTFEENRNDLEEFLAAAVPGFQGREEEAQAKQKERCEARTRKTGARVGGQSEQSVLCAGGQLSKVSDQSGGSSTHAGDPPPDYRVAGDQAGSDRNTAV